MRRPRGVDPNVHEKHGDRTPPHPPHLVQQPVLPSGVRVSVHPQWSAAQECFADPSKNWDSQRSHPMPVHISSQGHSGWMPVAADGESLPAAAAGPTGADPVDPENDAHNAACWMGSWTRHTNSVAQSADHLDGYLASCGQPAYTRTRSFALANAVQAQIYTAPSHPRPAQTRPHLT